jgi:hypothetical protein
LTAEPSRARLQAEIAALRAATETELQNVNARLTNVEEKQDALVTLATTGKASLRTLCWLGAIVTAALSVAAAVWSAFFRGT